MIKLPFVLEPTIESSIIGNAVVGEIEIPKYCSLTKNEEDFIEEYSQELPPENYKLAIEYAAELSKELEIGIREVANALLGSDYDFFKGQFDKIFNFNDKVNKHSRIRESFLNSIIATAIIKFRLVSDWTLADTNDPNKISPRLVKMISEFGIKERDGWEDDDVVIEASDSSESEVSK